nr:DUF2092 domain-containing protein [Microcystis sp. LEGE 08355]
MIMRRFMPILSLLLPWVTAAGVLAEIPTLSQEIRPKTAEQVIEQLCANLTKQRSFTVKMDVTYDDVLDSGAKVQYSAYQNIWVEKPDRLRSDYTGVDILAAVKRTAIPKPHDFGNFGSETPPF